MKVAKWIFNIAGVWGVIVLTPMFLLEQRISSEQPPAITHPEYFYGFLCMALTFQFLFFAIASNPPRFRPVMPVAMLEKFSFPAACLLLQSKGRVPQAVVNMSLVDLLLGVLFVVAWLKTPIHHASVAP